MKRRSVSANFGLEPPVRCAASCLLDISDITCGEAALLSKTRNASKLSLIARSVAKRCGVGKRHIVTWQWLQRVAYRRRVVKLVAPVENVGKRVAASPVEIERQGAPNVVARLVALLVVVARFACLPAQRRSERVACIAVKQRGSVSAKHLSLRCPQENEQPMGGVWL